MQFQKWHVAVYGKKALFLLQLSTPNFHFAKIPATCRGETKASLDPTTSLWGNRAAFKTMMDPEAKPSPSIAT
jgi:hypothetical protein